MRVRQDQWIPGLETPFFSPTHMPLDTLHEKVDSLIDPINSTWNMATVNNLFSPPVAAAIRKIPLSLTLQEDRWIWREERDEKYSLKSAYRLIHHASYLSNGEPSNAQELNGLWKNFWKSMSHPRSVFLLGERVGMASRLCRIWLKKIMIENKYIFYNHQGEDTTYTTFYCS